MSTILGVNFGREFFGGPETMENKKTEKLAEKLRWRFHCKFCEQSCENLPDQNNQFTRNPLCGGGGGGRNLGINLSGSLQKPFLLENWSLQPPIQNNCENDAIFDEKYFLQFEGIFGPQILGKEGHFPATTSKNRTS